jgi:hypothetical protein
MRRQMMPAFLEFLAATSYTGMLDAEGPSEFEGRVVVNGGSVIFAACLGPDGWIEGLDALRSMLRWRYTYIELFDALPPNITPNVKGSILHVLLEAARLEDELSRERELPGDAIISRRHSLRAAEQLGGLETMLLTKYRNGMTVNDLRRTFTGMPVDSGILELINQGLFELQGVAMPPILRQTVEGQQILAALVPLRTRKQTYSRGGARTLHLVLETVYALVDGIRTAEDIRQELRMAPGRLRAILRALRSQGRIEF